MIYRNLLKPFFDFIIALTLSIILSPIFILIFILLMFSNKGKVFFIQPRPGKDGQIFKIVKFRTMNNKKNKNGELLPDIERLTFLGKIIRKSSLDEISQIINVLKGDMSLVGPRPLLVDYLPLYTEYQKRRHEVKPGITGWAQINGRNAISWDEKFKLDIWYVDHLSFILDMRILLLTVKRVFKMGDINRSENTTMPRFTGSDKN